MDAPAGRRPKAVKLNLADIAAYRRMRGENQAQFWTRFGVTQSGGSRYESGRALPKPVRILLTLFAEGKLTDDDLKAGAGGRVRRRNAG